MKKIPAIFFITFFIISNVYPEKSTKNIKKNLTEEEKVNFIKDIFLYKKSPNSFKNKLFLSSFKFLTPLILSIIIYDILKIFIINPVYDNKNKKYFLSLNKKDLKFNKNSLNKFSCPKSVNYLAFINSLIISYIITKIIFNKLKVPNYKFLNNFFNSWEQNKVYVPQKVYKLFEDFYKKNYENKRFKIAEKEAQEFVEVVVNALINAQGCQI